MVVEDNIVNFIEWYNKLCVDGGGGRQEENGGTITEIVFRCQSV